METRRGSYDSFSIDDIISIKSTSYLFGRTTNCFETLFKNLAYGFEAIRKLLDNMVNYKGWKRKRNEKVVRKKFIKRQERYIKEMKKQEVFVVDSEVENEDIW